MSRKSYQANCLGEMDKSCIDLMLQHEVYCHGKSLLHKEHSDLEGRMMVHSLNESGNYCKMIHLGKLYKYLYPIASL